jgi:hypothetical protein
MRLVTRAADRMCTQQTAVHSRSRLCWFVTGVLATRGAQLRPLGPTPLVANSDLDLHAHWTCEAHEGHVAMEVAWWVHVLTCALAVEPRFIDPGPA